jgi:sugar O-acyltransferase (sialic acid O-acetyltransferase NeuD family)
MDGKTRSGQKDLIILGAGGTGEDVLDWLEESTSPGSGYRCIGFLDDDEEKRGSKLRGVPVLGPLRAAIDHPGAAFVDALGGPRSFTRRPALVAGIPPGCFVTLVHRRAHVSSHAQIGSGCLVYPHVVVGPAARIGSHVTILANVVVNHEVVIGDYSIVASAASLSGRVRIGTCCYIGAGSHIREGGLVGDGALVGIGSVVIREVPPRTVVVGNPARILRQGVADG